MNVNNNQFNTAFSSIKREKQKTMTKDEIMDIVVPKAYNLLSQRAEKEVPENGKFRRIFVAFDIPETRNEALISIENDAKEPNSIRRLVIGVHRLNSDRVTSNYIFYGTKKEILEYLKKPEIKSDYSLSKSVDDYYSSL